MISSAAFDKLVGTELGHYRLVRFLGQSEIGPTFLASTGASASYLVRFLGGNLYVMARERDMYPEQFQYRARQMVTLQHPYILPLLDYGIYQGTPFLVSPHPALRSLRRHLALHGPMEVSTVGRYLDQLASALDYAHEQGMVHGRLTLDGIFVRLDGRLVVADFGVRELLELNTSRTPLSRRDWVCSPEQVLGRPSGPSTDVYALGALLYQLLTGSPVFAGTSAFEVNQQHLFAVVPPLGHTRSDLPAGLDRILARALAKGPWQRYQQAGALANAYHQVASPDARDRVPFVPISVPETPGRLPSVPGASGVEKHISTWGSSAGGSFAIEREHGLGYQKPETPQPVLDGEDEADIPTLNRVSVVIEQTSLSTRPEDVAGADSQHLRGKNPGTSPHRIEQKSSRRIAVIALLLLVIASGIAGVMLISRQNTALAGLTRQVPLLASSRLLLGLCIALAIAFTVAFNIISRISLSTTRHESAYTILWQLCCALLVPFFLPFDHFSISAGPHVLPLLALSVVLWALVDAFMFSAFKYEEASVLSCIFPLNYLFTFAVSVVFFRSGINPTIVVGFLVIMTASLLVCLYRTRLRPSKGMVFALLYSFFLGAALGFNSEVVKSFSIPPYMFAAFLFPALANLLIFLRPKGAELRYELQVQWKKILLNAAVMDASFFFLLKAFQLGNVPQVVALSASSTLLTVLASVVVLKEDKHMALKILAAALATLGIVLVQL